MAFHFIKVGSFKASETSRRPGIVFNGDWLAEAGFVTDTVVAASFTNGGAVFNLCDESAGSAAEMVQSVKQNGYRLMYVRSCLSRGKKRPLMSIKAMWLKDYGFHSGALLVVMIEYGLIRVKVLDTDMFVF